MRTTIKIDEAYRGYTVKDMLEHFKKSDYKTIEVLNVAIGDRNCFKRWDINDIKEVEEKQLDEVFEAIEIFDDFKGNRIATLEPIKERSNNA